MANFIRVKLARLSLLAPCIIAFDCDGDGADALLRGEFLSIASAPCESLSWRNNVHLAQLHIGNLDASIEGFEALAVECEAPELRAEASLDCMAVMRNLLWARSSSPFISTDEAWRFYVFPLRSNISARAAKRLKASLDGDPLVGVGDGNSGALSVYDVGMNRRICKQTVLAAHERPVCLWQEDDERPAAFEYHAAPQTRVTRASVGEATIVGDDEGTIPRPDTMYLDLMKRGLTNYLYDDWVAGGDFTEDMEAEVLADPGADTPCSALSGSACEAPWTLGYRPQGRSGKREFSSEGAQFHTTLSAGLLTHIEVVVSELLARGVPGDLLEAGVFRGGATIFMRALLAAHERAAVMAGDDAAAAAFAARNVWVCDSFSGIPTPRDHSRLDVTQIWDERFTCSEDTVRANFRRYGLLDDHVRFVRGFFNESLPPVFGAGDKRDASLPQLALVRIDADAFDGVHDALTSLYPRLSSGGYVIIDDWHLHGARAAAHEYRAAHGIDAPILPAPSDFVQSCSAPSIAGPCVHPRRSVYFDHKHLLWDSPAQAAYWRKA